MEKQQIEIRHVALAEVRVVRDEYRLVGLAAPFDSRSELIEGRFHETIKRGAFRETILRDPVAMLHSHDPAAILGHTRNQTLKLSEDQAGLRFDVTLPATQLGHDVYELVRRGDLQGVSIGFQAVTDRWPSQGERELLSVKLFEVSLAAFPAYQATSVLARSDHVDIGSIGTYRVMPVPVMPVPDLTEAGCRRRRLRFRLLELEAGE